MILLIFTHISFRHMRLALIVFFSEPSSQSKDDEDNSANEPNGSDEIRSPLMQQQGLPTKELPRHRVVEYTRTATT